MMNNNDCVLKLKEFANKIDDGNIIFNYVDLLNGIILKGKLEIVFAGNLSNGKTTLINCILNKKLLPTSIGSTTSSVAKIQRGNDEIIFNDKTYDFSTDNLNKAINESKGILEIKIKDFPYNNVVIVDTPGVDDIIVEREQKTFSYIPESDAVVMVFDASKGITMAEKNFLENKIVQSFKDKIFLIFNKIDTISDEISISQLKNKLIEEADVLKIYKNIYAISAKNHIQNDNEEAEYINFKKDLDMYLSTIDKNIIRKKRIENILDKINMLANSYIKNYIDSLSKTAQTLEESIKKQKDTLEYNKIEAKKINEEFNLRLKELLKKLTDATSNTYNAIIGDLQSIQDIPKKMEYFNNVIPEKIKYLEQFIKENIKKDISFDNFSINSLFVGIVGKIDIIIEQVLNYLGKLFEKDFSFLMKPIKTGADFLISKSIDSQINDAILSLFNSINRKVNSAIKDFSDDLKDELNFEKIYLLENEIKSAENAINNIEKDKEYKDKNIEEYRIFLTKFNNALDECRAMF